MLQQLSTKNRKILAAAFVVILSIIGLIVYLAVSSGKNQFGNFVAIQQYDQKIQNLPSDMKDSVQSGLYNTLEVNGASADTLKNTKDAIIRELSDTQSLDESTQTYSGSFIVDVQSLKQSYRVKYLYSTGKKVVIVPDRSITISCLPTDQLIYGSFNCIDETSVQNGTTTADPILSKLPVSSLNYDISALSDNSGKVLSLSIKLNVSEVDYNTGIDEAIARYKSEALSWITSAGFDPAKYTINYTY